METLKIRIEGTAPLLMHNGQLADPINEHTQALSDAIKTAKKSKTDNAWEAAYKVEFLGGLYLGEDGKPCIPGEMLEAVICEGAKKSKQGKEVKAGVIVDGNFPLEYKGPGDPEALWKARFYKKAGVKVGQNRVIRTRPMFMSWACEFVIHFNPEIVNKKDLIKHVTKAGAEVGLGDYRPRYGRFLVVS